MTKYDSFNWGDLLCWVEEGRVIPVVGTDLLIIDHSKRKVSLYHYLSKCLAERLAINKKDLISDFNISDIALTYIDREKKPQRVYSQIKAIMDELQIEIPVPLIKLARIFHFKLFVSTTFDDFMATAIDQERFGGSNTTNRLAFRPFGRVDDLPGNLEELEEPVVYHILGKLSSSSDYAVTDEDVLEFIHTILSSNKRPNMLLDSLKNYHILFLGCSYPNWLARFFFRTVRNEKLSIREMEEIVVDDKTPKDSQLVFFLDKCGVEVFSDIGAVSFVDELYVRWQKRNSEPKGQIQTPPDLIKKIPEGAIFLSYAREDEEAALALKKGLESVGLDVWFDQYNLKPGQNWDREIEHNIRKCSLFMPLISYNTETQRESYFRKEWKEAVERTKYIAENEEFIIPIAVDNITPGKAKRISSKFRDLQWVNLPGGKPSKKFLEGVKNLFRDEQLRRRGCQ